MSRPSCPVNGTISMPDRMGLDSWKCKGVMMNIIKSIVVAVVETVGFVAVIMSLAIFGLAFS